MSFPSNSSSECKDGELPAKVTEATVDNAAIAATINRRSSRNILRPKRLVDYVVEVKQLNKEVDNGTIIQAHVTIIMLMMLLIGLHCVQEKKRPKCFCRISYKTRTIVMKLGT